MKKIQFAFLVFALIFTVISISFPAFGHQYSQEGILAEEYINHPSYMNYYIGGETIGWSIDEGIHIGTTTIYYKFDSGVSDEVKAVVRAGFSKWSSTVRAVESSTATGTITTFSDVTTTTTAMSIPYGCDNNGHLTGWEISINTAKTLSDVTLAHELGHVIGLNDLYSDSNKNKLMYGARMGRTATAPTDSDLWGARVILGLHTTHTFSNYRYWGQDSNGNHCHVQYCSDCNGNKATQLRCFFPEMDPQRRCITCGYSLNQMKSLT